MPTHRDRVPDWLLERLAAGELPAARERALRTRLREAGEADRLPALAASNAEILAALPPERVVPEIERRAASARPAPAHRPRSLLAFSLAATCAAGLAVFLLVRDPRREVTSPTPVGQPAWDGIKGLEPSLRVHRKTAAGSELLPPGATVRQGDTLQLRYVAAGRRFGVIASVDARGGVTLHLPEAAGPAATLHPDGERALPHAFELDDVPGFERFVFVTAAAPFSTADVTAALASGQPIPSRLTAFELTFKKTAP